MFSFATLTIQDNPIFGDYGSYVQYGTVKGIGSYAHNVASAWVNLGLLGFILYISAICIALYQVMKIFFSRRYRDVVSTMTYVFSIAIIISLLFSKNYSFMLFGLMVGLTSRFEKMNKRKLSTNKTIPSAANGK